MGKRLELTDMQKALLSPAQGLSPATVSILVKYMRLFDQWVRETGTEPTREAFVVWDNERFEGKVQNIAAGPAAKRPFADMAKEHGLGLLPSISVRPRPKNIMSPDFEQPKTRTVTITMVEQQPAKLIETPVVVADTPWNTARTITIQHKEE